MKVNEFDRRVRTTGCTVRSSKTLSCAFVSRLSQHLHFSFDAVARSSKPMIKSKGENDIEEKHKWHRNPETKLKSQAIRASVNRKINHPESPAVTDREKQTIDKH